LSKHNHYYYGVKKYFIKAGITFHSRGSRVIRQAFATRLANQKTPIKTISDLLGHRWIETTFIYTKVDVISLRELARPWPEVV
jgi:site-specific recombinase XerD